MGLARKFEESGESREGSQHEPQQRPKQGRMTLTAWAEEHEFAGALLYVVASFTLVEPSTGYRDGKAE